MAKKTGAPLPELSRRQFARLSAAGLASLALPAATSCSAEPEGAPRSWSRGAPARVGLAGVVRGAGDESVDAAVRRAAFETTDFSWLSRGDAVLIKVVCNSGNVYPATTDPVALRAMIGLLREQGAGRVIVADMSGVQFLRFHPDSVRGSTRELMTGNGLVAAAESAGAEVYAFEEPGWDAFHEEPLRRVERLRPVERLRRVESPGPIERERPVAGPVSTDSWGEPVMMPSILHEVDHIVLMPRCSRHLLAGSTLGLKAAVGWWRHDSRLVYHRGGKTLAEKTAEANAVPSLLEKQRLVLTSATKMLTTFGPDDGYVMEPEVGLMIASSSVVAHDMVSLAWLLEGRRTMEPGERDGVFKDPHTSQLAVGFANRVVTAMLGGIGQALRASAPVSTRLETIFDDRVLARAFDVFGGVPQVEIAPADDVFPQRTLGQLRSAVLPPA